jgi:formylglycine-generating enzyme required for sulfatase activity
MTTKPWFIHDQQWRILLATENRKKYLETLRTDSERPGQHPGENLEEHWHAVDSWDQVALDQFATKDHSEKPIHFRRLMITSDAGIGKTKATEWLAYRINHPADQASTGEMAFLFQIRTFLERRKFDRWTLEDVLLDELGHQWLHELQSIGESSLESFDPDVVRTELRQYLVQAARRGELTLIFDGLDQASDSDLDPIFWLLDSPAFKRCRFILAARSNKICSKWERLNQCEYWTYLRVDDFDTPQQIRYLGWLPPVSGGSSDKPQVERLRFNEIHRDARRILNVPRVLWYLRERVDFTNIRTACDVYDDAVTKLIEDGLRNCVYQNDPQTKINDTLTRTIKKILAVTAYESIRDCQGAEPTFHRDPSDPNQLTRQPSTSEDEAPPYVHDITHDDGDFDRVKEKIKRRWQNELKVFEENWTLLGRLNTFLEQGIFDSDQEGLNRIVWSNRSLHEYLLALYFAKFAEDGEESILWDWITIHGNNSSDQYYHFWQFFCEMPSASRDSYAWLRGVALLFWPNIPFDEPTLARNESDKDPDNPRYPFFAKRSCEMIYRAWDTLDAYCQETKKGVKTLANQIRDRWWGEFERDFLSDKHGAHYQQIAKEIRDGFIAIPSGSLHMGTTWEKQVPDTYVRGAHQQLQDIIANTTPDQDGVAQFFSGWDTSSRAVKIFVEQYEPVVRRAVAAYQRSRTNSEAQDTVVRAYIRDFYQMGNEREIQDIPINAFQLARTPTLNRQIRLFDSGRGGVRWKWYTKYSTTEQHPAVAVSFFDGWVYCKWLRWEGNSCRLPWETQWEYAAKVGLKDWTQGYWFGDEFDSEAHAERIICREVFKDATDCQTAEPSEKRPSPDTNLIDMHGNVWEWCQDVYRFDFRLELQTSDTSQDATSPRVLRGGSFGSYAFSSRCSYRSSLGPSHADSSNGVRVSRAHGIVMPHH